MSIMEGLVLPPATALLLPLLGRQALPALPQLPPPVGIETLKTLTGPPDPLLFFRGQLTEAAVAFTDVGALFRCHRFPSFKALTDLLPFVRG